MFLTLRNVSINTENISYILEDNNNFYMEYRKKASIKKIELPIDFENMVETPHQFFSKLEIYNLNNYWINTKMISFIEENHLSSNDTGGVGMTHLLIYFKDGMMIDTEIETSRWNVWKGTRLGRSVV